MEFLHLMDMYSWNVSHVNINLTRVSLCGTSGIMHLIYSQVVVPYVVGIIVTLEQRRRLPNHCYHR